MACRTAKKSREKMDVRNADQLSKESGQECPFYAGAGLRDESAVVSAGVKPLGYLE